MSTSSLTATCNCAAITYTVTGTDKGAVACHCANCQKASGSAFMHNYRFMKSSVTYQKGEDLVKTYEDSNTKSGSVLKRNFCSNCGSPLFVQPTAFKGLTIIHAGTAQDRSQPLFELFEENKHPWLGQLGKKKANL